MPSSETSFIFSSMLLLGFISTMFVLASGMFPELNIMTMFNPIVFGGGLGTTAIACASIGGVACAASAGAFVVINYLTTTNIYLAVFLITPIYVTLAYIVARLARGGG